jgi:transposase InsO family protein
LLDTVVCAIIKVFPRFGIIASIPQEWTAGFANLLEASVWVGGFVQWYNHEHRHSAINFVTPVQRHAGEDHTY